MLLQFVLNGVITGAVIGIVAIGFWLIYRSTNILNISHGAIYTLSAFIFYSLYKFLSPCLAFFFTFILTGFAGLVMYIVVYRPLEKKNASPGVMFVSSLAIYILVVNIIAMIYGNDTKIISEGLSKSFDGVGIIITLIQVYELSAFIIIFLVSYFFIKYTRIGRMIIAIGDNPVLFKAMGLNEKLVKSIVFIAGSAVTASASVLSGTDIGIDPYMGMIMVLNAVVAVIAGGVKKIEGVIIASILIGIIQNLVIWKFSSRWESAVTFLLLTAILLYKSGGILVVMRRVEEL